MYPRLYLIYDYFFRPSARPVTGVAFQMPFFPFILFRYNHAKLFAQEYLHSIHQQAAKYVHRSLHAFLLCAINQ